jgi:hypothetical protein
MRDVDVVVVAPAWPARARLAHRRAADEILTDEPGVTYEELQ